MYIVQSMKSGITNGTLYVDRQLLTCVVAQVIEITCKFVL